MTALLEFKQKLKGLYAQYEIYLLPLLKFILAAVYFTWINTNMGYMKALDSMFVVLILALICCILPSGMMIFRVCTDGRTQLCSWNRMLQALCLC